MTALQQVLQFLAKLVQWWVIIEPWEQAVRVRLGNRIKLFNPGIHFRVPFIDAVYPQNVRLRTIATNPQTVTTNDGHLIMVCGVLRFRVNDVVLLQTTLNDAAFVLTNNVCGLIADLVAKSAFADLSPTKISEHVNSKLDFDRYGLCDYVFILQDYAVPRRVYRLISDGLGIGTYNPNLLTTNAPSRDTITKSA